MRVSIVRSIRQYSLIEMAAALVLAGPAWGQQAPATSAEHESKTTPVVRSFGTDGGYRTEVISQTKGTVGPDDRRQVSLLAAQVFQHVDEARSALDADDFINARKELEKGLEAVKAVRALLPKTAVHTRTTAPDGKVIYEDQREVQDDQVPLFEGMLHARTLAPIQEAQRDANQVVGVRVLESQAISTEVMADLGYVQGQLGRAVRALEGKKTEDALRALVMAQIHGVQFQYNREDSPLAEARDAIWLTKRALEENNTVQARANLAVARQRLEIYRQVLPEAKRGEISQMLTEVGDLERQLQHENKQLDSTAERSRQGGFVTQWWDRLNGWIKRQL
jgi:YfdX protein